MQIADSVPHFTYLVEQIKLLKLVYLHIIKSRAINNVDTVKTEKIEFLLDIWCEDIPGSRGPTLR
jgi:hypothetical protein